MKFLLRVVSTTLLLLFAIACTTREKYTVPPGKRALLLTEKGPSAELLSPGTVVKIAVEGEQLVLIPNLPMYIEFKLEPNKDEARMRNMALVGIEATIGLSLPEEDVMARNIVAKYATSELLTADPKNKLVKSLDVEGLYKRAIEPMLSAKFYSALTKLHNSGEAHRNHEVVNKLLADAAADAVATSGIKLRLNGVQVKRIIPADITQVPDAATDKDKKPAIVPPSKKKVHHKKTSGAGERKHRTPVTATRVTIHK